MRARPDLDRWLGAPAVRTSHRRESRAGAHALWLAAAGVRLRDCRLLGRLVGVRVSGTEPDMTFDTLFRTPPFVLLDEGPTWLLSGLCGRIWTIRGELARLSGPQAFLDWQEPATVSLTLLPFTAAGVFLVLAYDLEWFGGRFHTDFWFAAAWGGFPAATGFWVNALTVRPAGVLAVAACFALSVAQRRLSSPVRELRRRTVSVTGEQRLRDGRVIALDTRALAAPLDGALRACALAVTLLAIALVVLRLH